MDIKSIIDESEGFGVIYKLTSPSGKSYIGQTIAFAERYSVYKRRKKNSIGIKLFNALNKYNGIENFEISILSRIGLIHDIDKLKEILNALEICFIEYYDTYNSGYNSTKGGEGCLGRVTKNETKQKISAKNKGNNAVEKISCICSTCGKEFKVKPCEYRRRIKQSKTKQLYCSKQCGAGLDKHLIKYYCGFCEKEHIIEKHKYNKNLKNGKTGKLFCNSTCYHKYLKTARWSSGGSLVS